MSVIVNSRHYMIDGNGKNVTIEDYNGSVKTVQVEVTEILKRVIDVEIPDDAPDSLAVEVVGELYDYQDFYLDGEDLTDSAEIELA